MRNSIIILHIPHSQTRLTKEFKKVKKIIANNEIDKFNKTISDLYTDKLFLFHKFKHIKFKYSRICCDVEKDDIDEKEIMSKYGMGVVYSKTNNGKKFVDFDDEYKNAILKKYYYPHHKKFENDIKKLLMKNKQVIIVDCHSFSKEIILHTKVKDKLPDICIGFNKTFINHKLVDFTKNYFENLGYSTSFNYPYDGSYIPNNINPNENILSIMLEINKEIYLKNNKPNDNFIILKRAIFSYLKKLETLN